MMIFPTFELEIFWKEALFSNLLKVQSYNDLRTVSKSNQPIIFFKTGKEKEYKEKTLM